MPSTKSNQTAANESQEPDRASQLSHFDAAFKETRQLYAAFELLRKDDMFNGLSHLSEPLLRSLCEVALLLVAGSPRSIDSHLDGINQLRQQHHQAPLIESEIREVAECLERMSTLACNEARRARDFSDDAWRVLLILRSASKKIRHAEPRDPAALARFRKRLFIASSIILVIVASVVGLRAYHQQHLLSALTSDTNQRISDLRNLEVALMKYKHENGNFPATTGGWDGLHSSWGTSSENWIPGLAPKYIDKLPRDPRNNERGDEQYLYWSDGANYKLLAHNAPQADLVGNAYPEMYDPIRPGRAFGVWSSDGALR
ncbi:MAG: hypothetical protein RL518_1760 [Pseudomonadota bacterium]|jgi:hypothetical protein